MRSAATDDIGSAAAQDARLADLVETGAPVAGEPNPSLANMMRCGFRRVSARLNCQPGN